jgi:hypothetical protein
MAAFQEHRTFGFWKGAFVLCGSRARRIATTIEWLKREICATGEM